MTALSLLLTRLLPWLAATGFALGSTLWMTRAAQAQPAPVLAEMTAADDHPRAALVRVQRALATAQAGAQHEDVFWWSLAAARVLIKLERQSEATQRITEAGTALARLSTPSADQRQWLQLAQYDTQAGWSESGQLLTQVGELRGQAEQRQAQRLACEARGLETWLLVDMRNDDEAWIAAESLERCAQTLRWPEQVASAQLIFAQLLRHRLAEGVQVGDAERHLRQAEAELGQRPARFIRSLIEWESGIVLRHQKQWPAALKRLEQVRALSRELDDDAGVGVANLEIANVLLALERPAEALPRLDEAQRLFGANSGSDADYRMPRLLELRILALTRLRGPGLAAAIEQARLRAYDARATHHRAQLERAMAEGLASLGRHVPAYEMLQRSLQTEQSARTTARDSQIQRLQARYDTARREAENAALKLKGESARLQLQAEQDRRQVLTFGLVALALLAVLGFTFGGRELAQRRRMAAMALRDELTGQPNRRAVQAYAQEQLKQAQRLGLPFAVAMIDLDHFKQVNDRFGHATGDAVLKAFAEHASSVLRGQDRLGRWGGEEWLLVMPGTRLAEIEGVFERLRHSCATGAAPGVPAEARVTFSMGAAELGAGSASVDSLVAAADTALYRAKAEGRNRLALAAES